MFGGKPTLLDVVKAIEVIIKTIVHHQIHGHWWCTIYGYNDMIISGLNAHCIYLSCMLSYFECSIFINLMSLESQYQLFKINFISVMSLTS